MGKSIKEVPPDITGVAMAWKVDLEDMRRVKQNPEDATIGAWIVNAPWANMMWANYLLCVVHLREIPGQKNPPIKHRPDATHELIVMALNDDDVPKINLERLQYLTPMNYVGQLSCTDEDALLHLEGAVRDICSGVLSPDTDYVRVWKARFGDHCFKKYEPGSVGDIVSNGGTVIKVEGQEPLVIPGKPAPSDGNTKH